MKMEQHVRVRSLFHRVINDVTSIPSYDESYNFTVTDPLQIKVAVINNNSNNTSSNGGDHPSNSNGVGMQQLITMLSTIIGFLMIITMCCCMRTTRTEEAERRIRRFKRGTNRKKSNTYRLKQIQKSLIVQQVVHVDQSGQVRLSDVRTTDHISEEEEEGDEEAEDISNTSSAALGENAIESSVSETNSEDLVACCCICLEPYEKGDIVAWSSSSTEDCLHVFHRDCIYLWLENPKHNDCPSCRNIILKRTSLDDASLNSDDDEEGGASESQQRASTSNDAGLNNNSTTSVAYYIMHGLISRANQVKFNLVGQTISFDSEDSDFDGLYYAGNTRRNSLDEAERSDWLNHPSTFRRAMSFSDRIFSNTFSSNTRKNPSGATWKAVMSTDESDVIDTTTAMPRRASTKLKHNFTDLQRAHSFRRVVSAGPCTPLDTQKYRLDEQIRFLPSTVGHPSASDIDPIDLASMTLPFRRTSSLRNRLFNQESLGDYGDDVKRRIFDESAKDGVVEENVDNTDSTDEDNIIIQKAL